MNWFAVMALASALVVGLSGHGLAETSEGLGAQIEALKAGQTAIKRTLQQIRVMLQGDPRPLSELDSVILSVDGAWTKGQKTARLTIIEFTDYQCPNCGRHFRDVLPRIDAEYIKTGKVRYVVRDYPLEVWHPHALKAAEAARCAGDQGKYWEMHDRLLGNQGALAPKDLPGHARALGLDVGAWEQCLESGRYEAAIRKDIDAGLKAGVAGTPTFFVGLTEEDDPHVKPLRRIPGVWEYPGFKGMIESLLNRPR